MDQRTIFFLNGPTTNFYGMDPSGVYGTESFPQIEDMSNIYKREPFRHHSFISKAASGIVAGLGPLGYEIAITALARVLAEQPAK